MRLPNVEGYKTESAPSAVKGCKKAGVNLIRRLWRHLLSGSLLARRHRPLGSHSGQLAHGSRIPNSFWNTCSAVWTRPQRFTVASKCQSVPRGHLVYATYVIAVREPNP